MRGRRITRGIYAACISMLLLACAIVIAPRPGSAQTAASTWPTFHADVARDGVASVSGPNAASNLKTFTLPLPPTTSLPFISSPVVDAAGTAYIGSENGNVYALNPGAPTQPLWSFKTGGPVLSTPTVSPDGSTIFVGSDDGNVYALKAATGKQVWAQSLGSAVRGSPLVSPDGKTVYVASINGTVEALSAATGSVTWTFQSAVGGITGSIASTPDVFTLYFVSGSQLYSLAASGPTNGSSSVAYLQANGTSTPSVDQNGNIYVGTVNGYMDCFTATLSTCQGWPYKVLNGPAVTSSPAFLGGNAIFGGGNTIYAVNQFTGQTSWQITTGGGINSSPAVAAGNSMVYIGSGDGNLYAIGVFSTNNTSSAQVTFIQKMTAPVDSSPAIAPDGSVWAADRAGSVIKIGLVLPTPTSTPTSTPIPTASPTPTLTPTSTPVTPTDTPTSTPTPTLAATPEPFLNYSIQATKVEAASSSPDFTLQRKPLKRVKVKRRIKLTTYVLVKDEVGTVSIQEALRVTLKGKTVSLKRVNTTLSAVVPGYQFAFSGFFTPKHPGAYTVTGTIFANGHHKHAQTTFIAG